MKFVVRKKHKHHFAWAAASTTEEIFQFDYYAEGERDGGIFMAASLSLFGRVKFNFNIPWMWLSPIILQWTHKNSIVLYFSVGFLLFPLNQYVVIWNYSNDNDQQLSPKKNQ